MDNKTLWVGDLHCRLQYLDDFQLMADRIVDVASKRAISRIVLSGDLLHDHSVVRTAAFNAIVDFVQRLAQIAHVFILVGNHDLVSATLFCSTEHPFNAMKFWPGVTVVDKPYITSDGGIVFCPYVPKGRMVEALDQLGRSSWTSARVIFGHQEIRGASSGAIVSIDGDVWEPEFPLLISGHIHERSRLAPNMLYPGTPIQHTFADEPDKTISLFDENWNETRISLGLKKRLTLQIKATEFSDVVIPEDAHVRVEVLGTVAEIASVRKTQLYKSLISSGVKIVPRADEVVVQKVARNITYLQALSEKVALESQCVQNLWDEIVQQK